MGRALAIHLAARGKQILIIGRREALLQDLALHYPSISYLCADVASDEGLLSIQQHLKHVPAIEALVNNAGTIEPIVPLLQITKADWQQALNTNLNAALFLPQLLQTQLHQGRVLNIGSGAAYFPTQGWGAYCTTKAALAMLTRCWQAESRTIAFASVMPGIVDTEMQKIVQAADHMDRTQINFYKRLAKHQRLISIDTAASFLTWLLLDVEKEDYVAHEWDIYDTSHHHAWLKPPHQVLHWDF